MTVIVFYKIIASKNKIKFFMIFEFKLLKLNKQWVNNELSDNMHEAFEFENKTLRKQGRSVFKMICSL